MATALATMTAALAQRHPLGNVQQKHFFLYRFLCRLIIPSAIEHENVLIC